MRICKYIEEYDPQIDKWKVVGEIDTNELENFILACPESSDR